jgi:hypothetical protein
MPRPKIQLAILGQRPPDFDPLDIVAWSSEAFEVHPVVESYQLNEDAKGNEWEFTDEQLGRNLKRDSTCDILIILLRVKLVDNWYLRRLTDNRVIFTFYELDQIVRLHRLPLKNLALRVLYATVLIYKRYGDRIPVASENTNYAHDETRGCLFDMNASKSDVIHSLHKPQLCEFCLAQLRQACVSNESLQIIQGELKRIQKPLIDRIASFIREHTVWSIFISVVSAIFIETIASLLAAYIVRN